ncbi:unnamed protein product, partial [Heterosigma akashiwo]
GHTSLRTEGVFWGLCHPDLQLLGASNHMQCNQEYKQAFPPCLFVGNNITS